MNRERHDSPAVERMRWLLGLAGFVLVALGVYTVLTPFLIPLAWAIVIVTSLWPLYTRLTSRIPGRPTVTALLMTTIIGLVVVGAVIPLLGTLSNEVADGARGARLWLEENRNGIGPAMEQLPFISPDAKQTIAEQVNHLFDAQAFVVDIMSGYHSEIARVLGTAAKSLAAFAGKTLFCLVSAFFLFRHGEQLSRDLSRAFHRIGGGQFDRILAAIRDSIKGGVYGIIATACAQGLLSGLGFAVAGAPVPVLLGLATMILSPIPFGAPAVYIPTALTIFVRSGEILPPLLLVAWGIGVVSTIDNILRPLFISQATSMNLLVVFAGVIGGLLAFGFIGIFVGPALLAIAQVLWSEWIAGEKTPELS